MKSQKMKMSVLFSLATIALTMTVQQAHAVWIDMQLTPESLKAPQLTFPQVSFAINSKDVDAQDTSALKDFEFTVEPKENFKLSPVSLARLTIMDGETNIAVVPVKANQEGRKVTYWFRVAPKFIANSKFSWSESGYAEVKDAEGNTTYVGEPGGIGYWFYLRDFANPDNR